MPLRFAKPKEVISPAHNDINVPANLILVSGFEPAAPDHLHEINGQFVLRSLSLKLGIFRERSKRQVYGFFHAIGEFIPSIRCHRSNIVERTGVV